MELGQTYTGGPELSVRCFGPGGPPLDLRSADGTLWVQFADLDVAVDLELRATDRDPLELLDGSGGHEAAAALHERAGGDAWRPIPPFDVVASALSISPIPGANAIVAHETVGSPVGTFAYYDTFTDGVLVGRHGGLPSTEPLVHTRMSFAARVAPPDVPLLEQVEGSQLRGRDDAALMLVAGLYDRAPVRHAIRGERTSTNRLLARLAAHTCAPPFWDLVAHAIQAAP